MSKQASKTVIGSFVVSALVLVVVGVLIFGSGNYLKERYRFMLFFQDSVKGLSVGAPVIFMGVQIGEVKDINVIAEYCDQLIEQGLRARLGLQSVVTGQLQIELDFFPEEAAVLMGMNKKYQEIPTIPSTFEKLTKTLENLPVKEVFDKLSSSLTRIDVLLNSPGTTEFLKSLKLAVEDARKVLQKVDKQVQPMTDKIGEALKAYQNLAQNLDRKIDPLISEVNETVKALAEASKQAEETLRAVENVVGDNSVVTVELTKTLREFSSAARSIRNLSDYLSRHPEALIRGKGRDNR
ncbi:MAG: MCE family protein [Deltaproteobacteria bacterium]|nr:MCE family protein [Deltaproteobacteria bacterium]